MRRGVWKGDVLCCWLAIGLWCGFAVVGSWFAIVGVWCDNGLGLCRFWGPGGDECGVVVVVVRVVICDAAVIGGDSVAVVIVVFSVGFVIRTVVVFVVIGRIG